MAAARTCLRRLPPHACLADPAHADALAWLLRAHVGPEETPAFAALLLRARARAHPALPVLEAERARRAADRGARAHMLARAAHARAAAQGPAEGARARVLAARELRARLLPPPLPGP